MINKEELIYEAMMWGILLAIGLGMMILGDWIW